MEERLNYNLCLKWFLYHINSFEFESPDEKAMADLKKHHTFRVVNEITWLAVSLGLNGNDLELAKITGLFHDVGRFSQFHVYKTFSDLASEDHAEMGIAVLKQNNIPEKFPKENRETLLYAINHHNKLGIPEDAEKRKRFFTGLIRDADKLDIMKVVFRLYSNGILPQSSPTKQRLLESPKISRPVMDKFHEKRPVNIELLYTTTDLLAFYISWTFDLNFDQAIKRMLSKGFPHRLAKLMPHSEQVKEIFRIVDDYTGRAQQN